MAFLNTLLRFQFWTNNIYIHEMHDVIRDMKRKKCFSFIPEKLMIIINNILTESLESRN